MGHISFILSLLMAGLFFIAIVTFAINFAYNNDAKINLANDPDFTEAKSDIEKNVSGWYSDVGLMASSIQNSTISTQTEATEGGTAFKVGPVKAILMASSGMRVSYKKVFGTDTGFGLFLTALGAALGFVGWMYVMKMWAGRSPD